MLSGLTIICFGEDLTSTPLSKFHIMKRFAATNQVLYFESLGMRHPTFSRRDVRRVMGKALRLINRAAMTPSSAGEALPDNFHLIKPLVLPYHYSTGVSALNARLLLGQIHRARRRLPNPDAPILLWVGLPVVPAALLRLKPRMTIYHLADKLVANVDRQHRHLADQKHAFWLHHADMVVTPSERFFEELREKVSYAYLLPHGVDIEHFAKASLGSSELPYPDDLRSISPPIVGFFGTISQAWFDSQLVGEVARRRPDIAFVFIGPVYDGIDQLPILQYPNIHFLGKRPYNDLPTYLARFSVCLIPKVRTEMTAASMPLKLREYLAAGKPVVSTLEHGDYFRPYVTLAETPDSFIQALDQALHEDDPVARSRERQAAVAEDTWDKVVEQLSARIIDGLLAKESG
jgi:glycosyltransferase involved in cell wall biosynthesis